MTPIEFCLAIAVPTLAVLAGILVNVRQFGTLSARMTHLEAKFDTRFDMLLSKVVEIGNRLTRLE
jgi:hypothetical protein